MDDVDLTSDRLLAEEQRRRELQKPAEIPEGTGDCWHCGEKIEGIGRWCDANCRDRWELERKRKGARA